MDRRDELIANKVKKGGLRARVDAHCISCVYDQADSGTWRMQVENCGITKCALWDVRPKSLKKD